MDATDIPITPNPEIPPPQVVIVVGWLMAATMVVATGTRLATKVSMKRILSTDDYLIVVATLVGIAQTVATYKHAHLTIESAVEGSSNVEKAYYSSQLLFIPAICIAKLSVLFSLHMITPVREHKATIIAFGALSILMLLAFEFSAAFQCIGAHWAVQSGQCFDQTAFWQSFGALDIATDAFIVIFPIYIVSTLQMGLKFKIVVAGVFATRITAIAASVCRLVYLTRSRATPEVDTFAFWIFILNTEIEQGLSIITSCVPFLKPFFESLETGMLAPSHGLASVNGGYGSGSGSGDKKSQLSNNSYKLRPNLEHGINVSSRISMHSEDHEGLIKEVTTTWIRPVPAHEG